MPLLLFNTFKKLKNIFSILMINDVSSLFALAKTRSITANELNLQCPHYDDPKINLAAFYKFFDKHTGALQFFSFLRPFSSRMIMVCLFILISGVGDYFRPLIIHALIERANNVTGETTLSILNISLCIFAFLAFMSFIKIHTLKMQFKMTWALPGLARTTLFQRYIYSRAHLRSQFTPAEFINITTRDGDSVAAITFSIDLIMIPLFLVLQLSLLYRFLGIYSLVAFAIICLSLPLMKFLDKKITRSSEELREMSRNRVSSVNEMVHGIRSIKNFSLEKTFLSKIQLVRNREVSILAKRAGLTAWLSFSNAAIPILAAMAVITVISLRNEKNSVADIFAALAVISTLSSYFSAIPILIQNFSDTKVALKRVYEFINKSRETEDNSKILNDENKNLVEIHAKKICHFQVRENDSEGTLKDIDYVLEKSHFHLLRGPIGSGKSTFLLALLGEKEIDGQRQLKSDVKFIWVPTKPWILSGTVRFNVLLDLEEIPELYSEVLRAAQLEQDLGEWEQGDLTEIGERGITLSGGQKQRVALARAAYQARLLEQKGFEPVLLLDDPLSALDETVANNVTKQLLQTVLGGFSIVMASHRSSAAAFADTIVDFVPYSNGTRHYMKITEQKLVKKSGIKEAIIDPRIYVPSKKISIAKSHFEKETVSPDIDRNIVVSYARSLSPKNLVWLLVFICLLPKALDAFSRGWIAALNNASMTPLMMLAGYAGIQCAALIFERVQSLTLFFGGVRAGNQYFLSLLKNVIYAPQRFFDITSSGKILSRFTTDIATIDGSLSGNFGAFLSTLLLITITMMSMLGASAWAALVFAPGILVYVILFKKSRMVSLSLNAVSMAQRTPWMSLLGELPEGVPLIRGQGIESEFLNRFIHLINRHISAGFYMVANTCWFTLRLELLGAAIVSAYLFLSLTVNKVAPSPQTALFVTVGIGFAFTLSASLTGLSRSLRMVENNLQSVWRIKEFTDVNPELLEQGNTPLSPWPTKGELRFEQVSFRYAPDLPDVLNNFELIVKPGEKLGIVGRTGAGKSSIFQALLRHGVLSSGQIFLDGVSIASVPLSLLRQSITIIPQDPWLFAGTLKENLDPEGTIDSETLVEALTTVGIAQKWADLSHADMLDLRLGEEQGSIQISSGEKQLLCLGRALLKRSPVILIDEATSNVDPATDALMQQVISSCFQKSTVLTIAHRVETLQKYDRIIEVQPSQPERLT